MNDIYKPGAVSSLISFQTSTTEKSKEQKKLDKLFGKTTKSSASSISQVAFNDVSKNVTIDLKSPKKKKKSKLDVLDVLSDKLEFSSPKEKKLKPSEKIKKKKDTNQIKNVVKEKKRNSEDISTTSRKKTKKFKEIATPESDDDKQSIKKAKKRKITSEEVEDHDGEKDDGPNDKKRKKFNKKNNNLTNGTGTMEKPRSSEPKTKKKALPVINDVLCALKETDGSKSRKRSAPKDLSDLEDEGDEAQKRRKKKRDKTNDYRTVFVGNLPLAITKKELKKLFSPCGVVENLRMRGAIPANPQRGKKYAILKKAYHSKCRSINAYICFVDKESVGKACELMNGKEVEGQHIRVNSSVLDKTAHDHKRSVFIGNLPFAIAEEDVRKHFLDCGEIANIRLVKDWKTGIGKGFGYVKFEEVDSADLAVKLDNSKLKNRKIRVHPSEADPKKRRTDNSHDKGSKGPEKAKVKKSDQKDFVGIKAEKKKKKKKPKHLARKMGLTTKKKDLPAVKPVEKVTGGPNKHMVFE